MLVVLHDFFFFFPPPGWAVLDWEQARALSSPPSLSLEMNFTFQEKKKERERERQKKSSKQVSAVLSEMAMRSGLRTLLLLPLSVALLAATAAGQQSKFGPPIDNV